NFVHHDRHHGSPTKSTWILVDYYLCRSRWRAGAGFSVPRGTHIPGPVAGSFRRSRRSHWPGRGLPGPQRTAFVPAAVEPHLAERAARGLDPFVYVRGEPRCLPDRWRLQPESTRSEILEPRFGAAELGAKSTFR